MAGGPLGHYLSCLALFVLLAGCAKTVAPPGGQVDTTPPEIIAASPATGTVAIDPESRIEITFSERIDPKSVERALFITPKLKPDPKIKAGGNRIIIIPKEPLKSDRTYVMTLGTDLRDAHNVKLAQSITIAFSTGATLDTGSIIGTVYDEHFKPAPNISIALFENKPDEANGPVDSLNPDYITQSGEGGLFAFEYIPPREYFLVAFDDLNKNHVINPERERFGLPSRSVYISSENPVLRGVKVALKSSDQSMLSLRSASFNADGLLKLRLSESLTEADAKTLFATLTIARDTVFSDETTAFVYSPLTAYPAADFVLFIEKAIDKSRYYLRIDRRSIYPGIDDSLALMTGSVDISSIPDASRPAIASLEPADGAQNISPNAVIVARFTEPIRVQDMTKAMFLTNESDTMPLSLSQTESFAIQGMSASLLKFGSLYTLHLNGPHILDRSGNAMRDSIEAFTFTTIGGDTLGQISGGIQYSESGETGHPVVLNFKPVNDGIVKTLLLERGQIEFSADLLPGYYSISGYIDKNKDGSYDFGTLMPYQLAEPFSAPADSIRVRSRFVTEDVVVEF